MLRLQDEMNSVVNEDWIERNHEWYRAIWVECAEMLDHYGWKWWKKQDPDMEQVQLELVDIWHFGLSLLIQKNLDHEEAADIVQNMMKYSFAPSEDEPRVVLERFASSVLNTHDFDVLGFFILADSMDLSFDELYRQYVAKNVLNIFRQNHGYKNGTYVKVWDGKEDNEHLVAIMDTLDSESPGFAGDIQNALEDIYPQ